MPCYFLIFRLSTDIFTWDCARMWAMYPIPPPCLNRVLLTYDYQDFGRFIKLNLIPLDFTYIISVQTLVQGVPYNYCKLKFKALNIKTVPTL